MNNRPKYIYSPNFRGWAIYKMTYEGRFTSGDKIAWYKDKEEAKRKVYHLNGWDYKEKK